MQFHQKQRYDTYDEMTISELSSELEQFAEYYADRVKLASGSIYFSM
jgi:hypothetical protein